MSFFISKTSHSGLLLQSVLATLALVCARVVDGRTVVSDHAAALDTEILRVEPLVAEAAEHGTLLRVRSYKQGHDILLAECDWPANTIETPFYIGIELSHGGTLLHTERLPFRMLGPPRWWQDDVFMIPRDFVSLDGTIRLDYRLVDRKATPHHPLTAVRQVEVCIKDGPFAPLPDSHEFYRWARRLTTAVIGNTPDGEVFVRANVPIHKLPEGAAFGARVVVFADGNRVDESWFYSDTLTRRSRAAFLHLRQETWPKIIKAANVQVAFIGCINIAARDFDAVSYWDGALLVNAVIDDRTVD
jgi:hypothetical protein